MDPRLDKNGPGYDPKFVAQQGFAGGGIISAMGVFLIVCFAGTSLAPFLYVGVPISLIGAAFLVWGYRAWREIPAKPATDRSDTGHGFARTAATRPSDRSRIEETGAERASREALERSVEAAVRAVPREPAPGVACMLCGSTVDVAKYGVYQARYQAGPQGISSVSWNITPEDLATRCYCDACVDSARRLNVRHASMVFFLPTVGMMRLWKFSRCSREELGDLMVASWRQSRDPSKKHILWPYGDSTSGSLETMTREEAQKRLRKRWERQRG